MSTSDDIECAFSGRHGTEPQTRTSKSGKSWLSFSVAIGNGCDTQWVQCALFGDSVQDTAARLHKGDRVYIEGRIKLNTWTDANGRERSGLSVASFNVVPLGQIGKRRPPSPKGSIARASNQPSLDAEPSRLHHDGAGRRDRQAPPNNMRSIYKGLEPTLQVNHFPRPGSKGIVA